jgi:uncharacterized delta-60 repeat protein
MRLSVGQIIYVKNIINWFLITYNLLKIKISHQQEYEYIRIQQCIFMKKQLFLYLLFSLLAARLHSQTQPLDQAFGNLGVALAGFDGSECYSTTSVLQPDGKVIIAGSAFAGQNNKYFTTFSIVLIRLLPDGAVDPSFGANGIVTSNFGSSGEWNDLAIQPDGKIIAGGYFKDYNQGLSGDGLSHSIIARFNTDGSPDLTFHGTGFILPGTGNAYEQINSLSIQPDGKILAIGSNSGPNIGNNYNFFRFTPDGYLDPSFAGHGYKNTILSGGITDGFSVLIQPDGKILINGAKAGPFSTTLAVARYLANGTLDVSFGQNGVLNTSMYNGSNPFKDLALQPDGKILLFGIKYDALKQKNDPVIARFLTNGALDSTFNMGSKPGFTDSLPIYASALYVRPDGKILATGAIDYYNGVSATLVGENGVVDSTFGDHGTIIALNHVSFQNKVTRAVRPDGSFILSGGPYGKSGDIWVSQRTTNGSIDTLFGHQGEIRINKGHTSDYITSMALTPDGKITTAGTSKQLFSVVANGARFNADGTTDTTYHQKPQKQDFNFNFIDYVGNVVQPDGKNLIFTLAYTDSIGLTPMISRFNVDGSLDTLFGLGGKAYRKIGAAPASYFLKNTCQALQSDGKIIAAGYFKSPDNIALAGLILRFIRMARQTVHSMEMGLW